MSKPITDTRYHDIISAESELEWTEAPEHPSGITERVLYDMETGHARLLRFEPGVQTDRVLQHEFYEQSYIIEGGLYDKRLGRAYPAGCYALRTPGMKHGPYEAPVGCIALDIRFIVE